VVRWIPAGVSELEGAPVAAAYRSLAFSPDGQTLWAAPSSGAEGNAWESSDALDLASETVATGPRWDTGVATHPAGGQADKDHLPGSARLVGAQNARIRSNSVLIRKSHRPSISAVTPGQAAGLAVAERDAPGGRLAA
jgi:hypothetical protein